ncbi:hypothetical protein [Azospirillum argentinense]
MDEGACPLTVGLSRRIAIHDHFAMGDALSPSPHPGDSGLRGTARTPAPACTRAQEASEGGRSAANRASDRRIRPFGGNCTPFAQSTSFGFSKLFGISVLMDKTEASGGFFRPPCDIVRSKGVVLPGSK